MYTYGVRAHVVVHSHRLLNLGRLISIGSIAMYMSMPLGAIDTQFGDVVGMQT